MVRGCQKKIIYLKNTESCVFEEAYFVVSDKIIGSDMTECDMVEEANRILDECISVEERKRPKEKIKEFIKRYTIPLCVGIIIGIAISLIIR